MARAAAFLLASLLTGCADLTITEPGPVGVGLTEILQIEAQDCHAYYGGEDCHGMAVRLDEARSRSPAAVVDTVAGEWAYVRGEQPGLAEFDVTTASGSTLTTTFEILDIVEQTLLACPTGQDCAHPLVFSRGYFDLDPVFWGRGADGRRVRLTGDAEIVVDAGETLATLRRQTRYDIAVGTGTVPGKVVVYTNTGIEQPLEIVEPDRIARIEVVTNDDGVVEVGPSSGGFTVHAFAADGREILGDTTHRPEVELDTIQLELRQTNADGRQVHLRRLGRGHGTATVRWGAVVTAVRLLDPSLPAT